ncbi:MAG: hypothetical protein ACYTG4_07190 [Planctomycetota bacterium]
MVRSASFRGSGERPLSSAFDGAPDQRASHARSSADPGSERTSHSASRTAAAGPRSAAMSTNETIRVTAARTMSWSGSVAAREAHRRAPRSSPASMARLLRR